MDRMKTFLLYFLGIVGFFVLSLILEDGLINSMYKPLTDSSDKYIAEKNPSGINIEVSDAKASNVNGHLNYKITNTSNERIQDQYVKLDLYSKKGLLAATEYIKIDDLAPGESKDYMVKFKGTEIADYKIAIIPGSELPDKSNIINILGFEFDLTNIFGRDLSNTKIFGRRLKDIFNVDKAKGTVKYAWNWGLNFARAVPWWGYLIGGGIILWYMPTGYLFGILPF